MKSNRTRLRLRSAIPFHLLIGLFGLYLYRFGYGFGTSDQDEFIPYLLSILDSNLFTTDWYVQTQHESFSVRTYFVYAILPMATLFSPLFAVTLYYILSWTGIAAGVFAFTMRITSNRLASLGTVFITLVLTPFWTLGGNDLVHSMLVPSMAAWAFGIWSLVLFYDRRRLFSAVLAGIATLFQALVGLQVCLLIGALLLTEIIADRKNLYLQGKRLLGFGGCYLLFASPALAPLFYQQFASASASPHPEQLSLFYIMGAFRNPHHYLFHSFSTHRVLQFAILFVAGTCALFVISRLNERPNTRLLTRMLLIICGVCMLAYLGTEVLPVLTVAKLQLFKLTVVGKLILVIAICSLCSSFIPLKVQAQLDRWLFETPRRITGILLGLFLLLAVVDSDRFSSKVYPLSYNDSDLSRIASWARTNTGQNAIFAVPPSWSYFRSHAKRGILVNHKAFPYKDEHIYEWFSRITKLAPVDLPERTDSDLLPQLDRAFESLSIDELNELADSYPFDYLIRSSSLPNPEPSFEQIHRVEDWHIYRRIDS